MSPPRPALWRMLWRGLWRRCPWCGHRGAFFTGWFAKADRCARCRIAWRRGDVGFELGPVTVTTILTFLVVVVGLALGLVLTAPDFAVVPITVVLVVLSVVVPLVVYPASYTLWQALDLVMRPLDTDEADGPVCPPLHPRRPPPVRR